MKKRISSRFYLIIVLNLVATTAMCQFNFKDKVAKNILAYHIRNGLDTEIGVDDGLMKKEDYIYRLVPMQDHELELYITRDTSVTYPVSKYDLYKIEKSGFSFKVSNDLSISTNMFHSFLADIYYLVAYNNVDKQLKYISGNMFLSPIADDFNLDVNQPNSFKSYLLLRYYNYKLTNLSFLKKKKGSFIFTAYSNQVRAKVKIFVDSKNIDKTKIRLTERRIVY